MILQVFGFRFPLKFKELVPFPFLFPLIPFYCNIPDVFNLKFH